MRLRRRNLRKLLIAVGCVVATVEVWGAVIGGLLLVAGSLLHLGSKGCLEQNRRLTTAGPYRFTRNPFYLANLLIDVGLCFVIGHVWIAALYLPLWWFSYRETMRREEARLLKLFPDAYPDYRASVPLLFPTGRRLPPERAKGRFSWNNAAFARGSEYARLLGIWIAPGMIWAGEVLRHERLGIFEDSLSWVLAGIVLLPCAWVVKLALAESFRRPETALLPFGAAPFFRYGMSVLLFCGAALLGWPWAMGLPVLWVLLVVLDDRGRARVEPAIRSQRRICGYFPSIAIGSAAAAVGLLGVLTHGVAG